MPRLDALLDAHRRPRPLPREVLEKFERHRREEAHRVATYGDIRPIIQIPNFHGQRMVVVRNVIYYSKKWKFFTDFLLEYGMMRLGRDWFEVQKRTSPAEQHPLWILRRQAYAFMRKQTPSNDGVYVAVPTGPLAACNNFYYDFYTVDDNGGLDDTLLARLKHRDQFQGALQELFAEATCLRAGFRIIHENEHDGTRRHVEFIAVHKATGQHILVEAKSRHRPGVLAQAGQRSPAPDFRFTRLIKDAIAKDPNNPLAIFVDTNLPPTRAERFYQMESLNPPIPPKVMTNLLDFVRKGHGGRDPYNLLVFSNHPQHYTDGDTIAPRNHVFAFLSTIPRVPIHHQKALIDLLRAADLYGNVPTHFPENPNAN